MSLPVTFGPLAAATMSQLDQNFAAVGALGILPGTVGGTNALTFTPLTNVPTIAAYYDFMRIGGVIATNNSGAVTARWSGLAFKNVYIDTASGPVALTAANSLVDNNYVTLAYDSALDSGTGGWHLVSQLPVTQFLDMISQTTGAMIYRTSVSWTGLIPGSSVQVIHGGTTPSYISVSGLLDAAIGSSVGMIATRTSVGWVGLTAGASGTRLTSQGPNSVLIWSV